MGKVSVSGEDNEVAEAREEEIIEEDRRNDEGSTEDGDALIQLIQHNAIQTLEEIIEKVIISTNTPIILDNKIVLCRVDHVKKMPSATEVIGEKEYYIPGMKGYWLDLEIRTKKIHVAYRFAKSFAQRTPVAVVRDNNGFFLLVEKPLPVKFVVAGSESNIV